MFKNKVYLVTGGASGIGRACARELLTAGAKVLVVDRDPKALSYFEMVEGAAQLEADVSSPEACQKMIKECSERFGGFDGAVNAAGVLGPYAPLENIETSEWSELLTNNLSSVFFSMQAEISELKRQEKSGSIVNVSSALGLTGFAMASPYVASKHAINGLTKSAALELAKTKIRVNAVAPGAVDTPLFRATTGSTPEGFAAIKALHPMDRVARPEEVAGPILHLLSDEASFITGTILPIDGGWTVP